MARSGDWFRSFNGSITLNTRGFLPLMTLSVGQTINRTLWSWTAANVAATSAGIPMGSSFTRVGLIVRELGATAVPYPITDATADFFAVQTVPWTGTVAESSNIVWYQRAGFGAPDLESRAQRTCRVQAGQQVYVSWETWVDQSAVGPITFTANAAVDCYVLQPPAGALSVMEEESPNLPFLPEGGVPGLLELDDPRRPVRAPLL